MQAGRGRHAAPRRRAAEQIELRATVHLAFDEFELGDLAFGLTVGPRFDDGVADSITISADPVGKRGEKTGAGVIDPRMERIAIARPDQRMN